ncbi:anthranilate synthase beta subunit 1, chloroplastic-like isoform X3 [Magnolia sinica]|uniref:anthranilate synthase beta subunit 1, chloroplastic-like isoform X1 n=1 Tax=Magnolia sinica TaxID=86752 RepID=UPI0026598EEA|nr:anthranilate synthase beta subunit 1, chloroplastic-like isoform X1 [Magnolia sinica]XP_058080107.1 anthranilate synthase beta subunit 1, chloroplastic-like isoform X1 [Magnolia sinica]XP_058080108.1 anthranilate synthase beta subunit 1, chloroplastic-like isoform X1 [Magnolia sinica]XP_058080109.1 anthranilate synthase beta subunit 1, chloroplastic-like isoform X1 [Magnolia sinica]XP_058080110.1 anthranilate synthase beta subunit 1, chloroplastic-like isoform X1 [Magnolia sinica]XP_0580801
MEGGTVLRSSSTLTRPSNFAAKSTVFATQRHDFVSFRTKSSPSTNGWIKTPAAVASAPHRLTGFLTSAGFGRGVVSASLTAASGVNSVRVSVRDGKKENPIIVIDNYDSFTYNLCQYMGELGANFEVYRNDELTVEEMKMKNPRGILISPGPGTPQDSGISLQTVLELGPTIPLFGVCMGLQCIGEAFGGRIVRSPYGVVHGKCSQVFYDEKGEDGLFSGLSNPFTAGRYHSLVIENDSFPNEALEITAWTEDGLVMAARHRKYKHIQGVQFHPESIITTEGKEVVRNFLKLIDRMEAGYIFVQP